MKPRNSVGLCIWQ